MPPPKNLPHNVLQEYLEALADGVPHPGSRKEKVLLSYAELQYQLRGGGKCAVCRTPVRHVLPVKVERRDGSTMEFSCLCRRCLEAEKAQSCRLTILIGDHELEYTPSDSEKPPTRKFRAYGM